MKLPIGLSVGPKLMTTLGVVVIVMTGVNDGSIPMPDFVPQDWVHDIKEVNAFVVGLWAKVEKYVPLIFGLAMSPQAGLLVDKDGDGKPD